MKLQCKAQYGARSAMTLVLCALLGSMVAAKAQTTILSEGFEGAWPGGWSVGDANASGTPAYWKDVDSAFGGEGTHSGSWKGYCAGVGYAGTATSPTYQNYMIAYMSRTIGLAGYSSATLTFWYKIPSIESGNYDKLRVYIGSAIIWERTTAQTAWTQVTLNLNSYVGTSQTLRFEFYSDVSGAAEGAYLDDILVMATATTCTDDSYEQDDTAGTAKSMACGATPQNRTICPGDEDWAYFTLSGSHTVVIATGARSGYAGGDTEMSLYGPNSSTTQIAYNDDFNGLWSQITANLGVGTYYIRVRELGNNDAIPGYTLSLSCTPVVTCGSDSYEADNTAGTAKTISCGTTQSRAICPVGDVDWATFTLSGSHTVVIATGARSGYAGGDTEMWLYGPNSSTTQIAYNDDFNGLWSQITANLGAGTYYIRVEELGNNAAIPGYTLSLSCTPIVTCGSDSYEADNTVGTAKPITDGQTQNRALCPAPDVDWAYFTMSGPGSALIRTGARSGYTGGDTVVWLYGPNSSNTQVAYNDDSGGTLWSEIQANNLSAGTYYIRVEEYGNDGAVPGYTLFLDTQIQCTDSYEPDDLAAASKIISDEETQNRSICPAGNEDWARFTVATAGSSVLLRTGMRSGYAGGDTVMWLYGPNNSTAQIGYNDDYNGLWSQITVANLAVGTYYVRLQEYGNNGTIPGYTLFLDIIPPTVTCADTYEPDDTAGTAKTITDGETQNRSICPAANEDWIRFTLSGPSSVLLRTGPRSGLAGGDTVMWLYGPNSSTTQIAYNDDYSGLWSQITVPNLPADTYHVRIKEYGNNGTIDGYTLFFDATAVAITGDAYEPDDSAAAAKVIADNETQNRSIHAAGNEDWARFTLTGPSDVLLRTGPRSGFPGGDTVMWLYGPNSSTTPVPGGYNDDFNGAWSQISLQNLTAGTYYVRIQEYGNNGTIDGYTLFFDTALVTTPPPPNEPNDTSAQAAVLSGNVTISDSIHRAGNADWFRFTLTQTSEVFIHTDGSSGDTIMYLYGPNTSTTLIESDDDDGNGRFSRIVRTRNGALSPGTYYIKIEEYGNNETISSYTLSLFTRIPSRYVIELDNHLSSPLAVGRQTTISGIIRRDGQPLVNASFGVHNGIALMSHLASTDGNGRFSITSTPIYAQAALVEFLFGDDIVPITFDVQEQQAFTQSLFTQDLYVHNASGVRLRATVTSPFGNQLISDLSPGETKRVVGMSGPRISLHPTVNTGVQTTFGVGAAGGDVAVTVDSDGVGATTVTVGGGVLLRFSVYGTTDLDAGVCWSPGGDVGAGAGASVGGSICLGTDGVSVGGAVGYGVLTSGFSLQLIE